MNKAETLRQLAASANAKKLEGLAQQIESLRTAKLESVEQLAMLLEPLAQSMAALTDETRETLELARAQAQEQAAQIASQIASAAKVCQQAANAAQNSAQCLEGLSRQQEWKNILMTIATGVISALAVSALWLWQAPQPKVEIQLDAAQLAQQLASAIAASKPSKGR